ncbi:PP2C family protein-serine/threonine phosphatase [Actinoplanes sichuanensis]|uniref:PP2C family protein-serine/threonine phosphatase n=1 Tax=Actinoplanes sichuanensis TaxID=512349 RepID=A0ABW4A1G9_9ACTN
MAGGSQATATAMHRAEPITESPPRPVAILLVEDDDGDVLLTREYLSDSGLSYQVEHVGTLAQAAAIAMAPDCVLLDLNLPDGQGLPALDRILKKWPDTAVVVLTGLNDTAMGAAAVAAGAQDYLVKAHVDGVVLGRTIQYAVQRRQVQVTERQLRESRLQALESTRLQRGLLPKPLTVDDGLTVTSRYVPGQQRSLLGGDFYDVVQDDDGAIHAVIGDVCGNGPDEAAIGVGLRVGWRTLTLAGVGKAERMQLLERVLVAERPHDAMFATACTIRISPDRSQAVVVSAGHPPPLVITDQGAYPAPIRSHLGLGMFPGHGRWQENTIALPAGAGLLLYTDGVYEGFTENGDRLGEQRFVDLASRLATIKDPSAYLSAVLADVQRGDDGRHSDDTALLYLTW